MIYVCLQLVETSCRSASPKPVRSPGHERSRSAGRSESPQVRSHRKPQSLSRVSRSPQTKPPPGGGRDERTGQGQRSPARPPRARGEAGDSRPLSNRRRSSASPPLHGRSRNISPSYSDRHRNDHRAADHRHQAPGRASHQSGRPNGRPPNLPRSSDQDHPRAGASRGDERHSGPPPPSRRPAPESRNGHSTHRQRSVSPQPRSDGHRRDNGGRYSEPRRHGPPPGNGSRPSRDYLGGPPPPPHARERQRHPADHRHEDGPVPCAAPSPHPCAAIHNTCACAVRHPPLRTVPCRVRRCAGVAVAGAAGRGLGKQRVLRHNGKWQMPRLPRVRSAASAAVTAMARCGAQPAG